MPTKTSEEKRLKRIRRTCPAKVEERMGRAVRENMKLVEIPSVDWDSLKCEIVLTGSTGNLYNINFGRIPHCNCPDYRKGNTTCKHILFVTTQVMGISSSDNLSFQAAYIGDELEEMYEQMEEKGSGRAFRSKPAVRKRYKTLKTDEDTSFLQTQMSSMRLSSRAPDDSDYVNFGRLEGLPSQRDTSSYRPYHWEKYPYRRYN